MSLQALGHHLGNVTPGKGINAAQWHIAVARVPAGMTLSMMCWRPMRGGPAVAPILSEHH